MLVPWGSTDTWNLLCQVLRGGEMLLGWGALVSPGQSLKGQVTYFCCLPGIVCCGVWGICSKEQSRSSWSSSQHTRLIAKRPLIWKSVKLGVRACSRLKRKGCILYRNPASAIFGRQSPWDACLGKRETWKAERKKLSRRQAHVGFEGFRHWSASSTTHPIKTSCLPFCLISRSQLTGKGQCCDRVFIYSSLGDSGNLVRLITGSWETWQPAQPALQFCSMPEKNGSLPTTAWGVSPGKTAIGGCLFVSHWCWLWSGPRRARIWNKGRPATRPCDLVENTRRRMEKDTELDMSHVRHHAAVSAPANKTLEQSLTGRCFYSNRCS